MFPSLASLFVFCHKAITCALIRQEEFALLPLGGAVLGGPLRQIEDTASVTINSPHSQRAPLFIHGGGRIRCFTGILTVGHDFFACFCGSSSNRKVPNSTEEPLGPKQPQYQTEIIGASISRLPGKMSSSEAVTKPQTA